MLRGDCGWNQLCDTAIRILSVIANSASCERLFSLFGIIHTKLRNRLGHQQVDKIARLRLELQREHARAGRLRSRLKRKLSNLDGEPKDAQPAVDDSEVVQELEADEGDA